MKATIALLAVLMAIAIFGCSSSSSKVIITDVHTGSDGLSMKFMDNSPPKEVNPQQKFPIAFEISNDGAYDIVDGYLTIIYEKDYASLDRWSGVDPVSDTMARFSLYGKSQYRTKGEKKTVILYFEAKELEQMTETHTILTSVNACYHYETFFGKPVCIDTDQFNTRNIEKSCEVEKISSSGQGAPVAVSLVEPTMYAEDENTVKPRFKITIRNSGQGEVINPTLIAQVCSAAPIDKDDMNLVTVKASLSATDLTCTPNPVRIRDNEGTTICEPEEGYPNAGTYTSLLSISLDYGYTDMISGTTDIRRPN